MAPVGDEPKSLFLCAPLVAALDKVVQLLVVKLSANVDPVLKQGLGVEAEGVFSVDVHRAESLAAAGNYTALEMTAESSREYVDNHDNTLSLTIDGGKVKSVTLRSASSDNVTMETADEVTEEVIEEAPEEIPGEEGGVG